MWLMYGSIESNNDPSNEYIKEMTDLYIVKKIVIYALINEYIF